MAQTKATTMRIVWKMVWMPRCCLLVTRPPSSLYHHVKTTQRLFGSKPGTVGPGGLDPLPGAIRIEDDQSVLPHIDLDRLKETIGRIRREIQYETYDVNLILLEDEDMQEANRESRGVDAPTDILSFPFHEAIRPGILAPPAFDIPDYYNLGDLLIDVPYVIRSCREDQQDHDEQQVEEEADEAVGAGADDHGGAKEKNGDDAEYETTDDDEEEYEPDRGVSLAMSKTYDPERRLHQLLVHGMLHLVGYDHEEDDEYIEMVEREEEILQKLNL
jgi:probable rRNA maturation factor